MTETVYSEREQHLIEMNRSLRRCLFHAVRMSGGELRIREHDLVKYPEAGESLRWRTDMERGDIVLRSEMLLPTVEFDLGEKYLERPLLRQTWIDRLYIGYATIWCAVTEKPRAWISSLLKALRHG